MIYINHGLMIADSMQELHKVAKDVGLERTSYKHKNVPHYPITASQRSKALKSGAVRLTNQAFLSKIRELKGEETRV